MGYAVAKAAADRGAEVTLVSGPVALEPPPFVKTIHVESAAQMFEVVRTEFSGADIVIKAAAVADYRPADVYEQKMKKTDGNLSIQLERTDDILAYLGANKKKEGSFMRLFDGNRKSYTEFPFQTGAQKSGHDCRQLS